MSQLGMLSLLKNGNNLMGSPLIARGARRAVADGSFTIEAAQSLPAMTSNTAPSGHSASTSASGGASAYLVFDQVLDTVGTLAVASMPVWFQRQTPTAIRVGRYGIAPAQAANLWARAPSAWTLSASNDGLNFTTLDSQANVSFLSNSPLFFDVPPAKYGMYSYHRISVSAYPSGQPNMFFTELLLLQAI